MTRMQGSRYLMHAYNYDASNDESYCVDISTLKAERIELNNSDITNFFIEGENILVVRFYKPMTIFRGLKEVGQIEFTAKQERCKNRKPIRGRYEQQAGHSVYAVDNDARLYRIEWQDIKDGKYRKTLVKSNVKNFYVDGKLGLATLNVNSTL